MRSIPHSGLLRSGRPLHYHPTQLDERSGLDDYFDRVRMASGYYGFEVVIDLGVWGISG